MGNGKKSRFSRCIVTHEAAWKLRPTSPISGRKSRREAKQRGSFRAEIFTIIRTNREPGHSTSPTGKRHRIQRKFQRDEKSGQRILPVIGTAYRPAAERAPSSFPKEWNGLERTQFHSEYRGHATWNHGFFKTTSWCLLSSTLNRLLRTYLESVFEDAVVTS